MKKTLVHLLLAAGILSLAGCQKAETGGTAATGDNTISFGASSVAATKTVYSNAVTNGYERIDWESGDVIRIYSDKAALRYQASQHYADYSITSVTADGRNSNAEISPAAGNGLIWGDKPENTVSYSFWGIYPATASASGNQGILNASIPASQDGKAENVKTYGFLTAAATVDITANDYNDNYVIPKAKGGKEVKLAFEPAFTAFEIELVSNDLAMTINSFTLSSASKSMAGDFTVSYNGTTRTCADANATAVKAITVQNPGEIAPASGDQAAKTVKLTVFAQPQTFNDLKISLSINVSGSAQTRSLKLTKNNVGVEFGACMKHRIKGVALPGELWNIYYAPITVDKWTLLDTTDIIVQ